MKTKTKTKTKTTTKRRKVWVNYIPGDNGGEAFNKKWEAEEYAGELALAVAVPFVEARPGDVVLSREAVKRAAELLRVGREGSFGGNVNDDVKKALANLKQWYQDDLSGPTGHMSRAHCVQLALAHIDGEPARTAAAVAAAREEQREACAQYTKVRMQANDWHDDQVRAVLAYLQVTYLTATPLADRIAFLDKLSKDRLVALEATLDREDYQKERAVKAEGHAEDARQFFIKERELRLAAEAERDMRCRLAKDILAAMDGAKP